RVFKNPMPERQIAAFPALAARQAQRQAPAAPFGARAPPRSRKVRNSRRPTIGMSPKKTRSSINGIASTNGRERTSNFREVPGGGSGHAQFGVQGVRSIASWKNPSRVRKPLCALRMRNGSAGADARGVYFARSRNAPAKLSETG